MHHLDTLETHPPISSTAFLPAHDNQSAGLTIWFTGLSGAGKSTIANAAAENLKNRGLRVQVLDADHIRTTLCRGLGYSREDRDENIRRIGIVADLLTRNGVIVLVAAISPYRSTRDEVQQLIGDFAEVYVNTPLHVCEERDPKGLYRKARSGKLSNLTGVDDPYEEPQEPKLRLDTTAKTLCECVTEVVDLVYHHRAGGAS